MIFLFKLKTAGFSWEDVGAIMRSERPGIARSSTGRKHTASLKCTPVIPGDYGLTPIGRRAHKQPVRIVAPTGHVGKEVLESPCFIRLLI